jgi:hypothetical protein
MGIPERAKYGLGTVATLLLVLAFSGRSEAGKAGWRHFLFKNSNFFSLAVTPDGTTHYFALDSSSTLQHLEIDRSGKVTGEEPVPLPMGAEGIPAVALDGTGNLHLVSHTSVAGVSALAYGIGDATGWNFQTIPNSNCGNYVTFALDSNNNPLVPCQPYDPVSGLPIDGLTLLSYDGTNWNPETVTTEELDTTAGYASIAAGTDGSIQITYVVEPIGDHLMYAVKRAGTWSVTDTGLTAPYGGGTYLALDSINNPGIVLTSGGSAYYAHFDGSSWSEQSILAGALTSNLVYGAGDVPTVIAIENSKKALYAQEINGAWQFQTIGQGPGLGGAWFGLDGLGIPHAGVEAGGMAANVAVFAYLAEPALSIALEQVQSVTMKSKQKITSMLQVLNQGSGGGEKFKVSYFLSDDPTIDDSATSLGTKDVLAPEAGASATSSFSFSVGGSVSGKYLIAQIAPRSPSQLSVLIIGTAAALIQ